MSRWSNLPPPPLISQGGTSSPAHTSSPRAQTSSPRSIASTHSPTLSPAPSHVYRSSSHTEPKPPSHPPVHFTYGEDDDHPASAFNSISTPRARLLPAQPAGALTSASGGSPGGAMSRSDPLDWEEDDVVHECHGCRSRFTLFVRKHHCRSCGRIFCDSCSRNRRRLTAAGDPQPQRVCDACNAHLAAAEEHSAQQGTATPPPPSQPSASKKPAMTPMSLSADDGSPVSPDAATLVSAFLSELRCMEEVMRAERAMREETEAMVLLMAAESLDKRTRRDSDLSHDEVDRLKRRVEALEEENAALRAHLAARADDATVH